MTEGPKKFEVIEGGKENTENLKDKVRQTVVNFCATNGYSAHTFAPAEKIDSILLLFAPQLGESYVAGDELAITLSNLQSRFESEGLSASTQAEIILIATPELGEFDVIKIEKN